jgi:hypothetical protein
MAVVVVQQSNQITKQAGISTLTSAASSWPANVTTGNSIFVFVWNWSSNGGNNISINNDSLSNAYVEDLTTLFTSSPDSFTLSIFRSHNVTGGGKPTFTVTSNGGSTLEFGFIEVSGLKNQAPVATSSVNTGTGTTHQPGNLTWTDVDAIAFSVINANSATNPVTFTTPTSYIDIENETDNSNFAAGDAAYEIFSGGGQTNHNPQWGTNSTCTHLVGSAVYAGVPSGTSELEGYRFRNDNGSEAAATWKVAQDTQANIALATNARLRAIINTVSSIGAKNFDLEYRKQSGNWRKVR